MTYEPVSLESLMAHEGWALRVARRLVRQDDDAEDLVQRTWLTALRRPPNSERGARAWIRTVILNLARERHRRRLAQERVESAFPGRTEDSTDAFQLASEEEIRSLLGERLMELEEPYRTVVVERYYAGRSSAEIARRLGIPAGTVRWRLKVALDRLRSDLDRRCEGDRSRWVSALLVFLPAEPKVADPGHGTGAARAVPTGGAPAAWIALASLGLGGILLLASNTLRTPATEPALLASAGIAPLEAATVDRTSPSRVALAPAIPVASTEAPAVPGLWTRVVTAAGDPVAEAEVFLVRASGIEPRARTDADGRAWFPVQDEDRGGFGLPSTRSRVTLRALAAGRICSPFVHVAPPFDAEHEVRLVVGGPESPLGGIVRDPEGRPIPGASVAWFEPMGHPSDLPLGGLVPVGDFASPSYVLTRTDADGRFRLPNAPATSGHVACFAPGFVFQSRTCAKAFSGKPLEIRLERGATLSGRALRPDGTPAAGIEIVLEPSMRSAEWASGLPGYDVSMRGFAERTVTDENGRYRIDGIRVVRARTLWARDPANGLVATTTLELEPGDERVWDPELAQRHGLRIRLVDEQGSPLAGWFVLARRCLGGDSWWMRRRETDAEGRLWIPDCPREVAFVDVFGPADVGASFVSTVLSPDPEEQELRVAAKATCTLTGRLTDDLGGIEARGTLNLHSLVTPLITRVARDGQGSFEARVAPGKYALFLELGNAATLLCQVEAETDGWLDLGTLSCPPMGTLRLDSSALATRGTPTYTLYLLPDDPDERGLLKVAGGKLEPEVLLPTYPGRYKLQVLDQPDPVRHWELRVAQNEETLLVLR